MSQDLREIVRAEFAAVYDASPLGVWSAPGAATVLGGPAEDLGRTVTVAIDRRAFVALGVRDDAVIRVGSTFADELAAVPLAALDPSVLHGWAGYPLGVAWALGASGAADLAAVPGVDLLIESDVPVGAGLGSSTALAAAVALALSEVWRLGLDRTALARVVQHAERAATGIRTGRAKPLAALLGRDRTALHTHGRGGSGELAFDTTRHGLALLVIDTLSDAPRVDGGFRDDERVEQAVTALALDELPGVGALLDASHRALRERGASSAELDFAVETAQLSGAIGARAIGGSAVLALVPAELVSHVQVAVDGAFAEHGLGMPVTFTVTPSGGARRER